eukprot:3532404-Rhodomonas_salina.1
MPARMGRGEHSTRCARRARCTMVKHATTPQTSATSSTLPEWRHAGFRHGWWLVGCCWSELLQRARTRRASEETQARKMDADSLRLC